MQKNAYQIKMLSPLNQAEEGMFEKAKAGEILEWFGRKYVLIGYTAEKNFLSQSIGDVVEEDPSCSPMVTLDFAEVSD